jgi:hypothetical protein
MSPEVEVDRGSPAVASECRQCRRGARGPKGLQVGWWVGLYVTGTKELRTIAGPVQSCTWYLEGRGSQALTADIDDDIDRG